MSDETTTSEAEETQGSASASESEAVNQTEERAEKPVDLGKEAAKAAAEDLRSLQDFRESLPSDQKAKFDELIEKDRQSNSNRAVNEAKKAWEAKQKEAQEKGEYLTQDQLDAKLAQYEERMKTERDAYDNFYKNLGKEGITPGTEEYEKVMDVYNSLVEEDAVNARLLLSEKGVRMLVASADVKPQAPAEPSYGYKKPDSPMPKPDEGYQPGDVQHQLRENMRKALEG